VGRGTKLADRENRITHYCTNGNKIIQTPEGETVTGNRTPFPTRVKNTKIRGISPENIKPRNWGKGGRCRKCRRESWVICELGTKRARGINYL